MSASKEARIELSGVIKEKLQDAKSVIFVKFNGLTVAEDTELRREFRKNDVEYRVYKNTQGSTLEYHRLPFSPMARKLHN